MLPSVVTAKGGHSRVCSFLCVCPAQLPLVHQGGGGGQDITKLLAGCQMSEFEGSNLILVSQRDPNPAPPNLTWSTLTDPVWNTGDRLVLNIIRMKGQNGQVTLFWENGWTDLEDLGTRSKVWMSYTLSVDWILHIAPGVPAPAKKVCCKKVLPSVVLRGATTVAESKTT